MSSRKSMLTLGLTRIAGQVPDELVNQALLGAMR